ncbi:hypothetical protein [Myceligenerans pegani]|uniref:DUF4386 family protein n=1 Tax=Myceligenerans pegani TaxID=2776917 RepID=A0ABR9N4R6_9MICO|nr:hypothetical protein [Myceligenerans sp. TRM 65318]MBE1878166.1 hypothetical protein [Myceligenerans sp. TRM 65318]MBE3020437.1 hypothetical protein [Myceligenerans sp. TRM 65318]
MTASRWTQAAFLAAGLAFLLFPVLRPWPDETTATAELAAAFAADRWVVSHLSGILGLGLLAPAFLGLRGVLAGAAGTAATTWALVTAWIGAGLSSLYFGAEIFGIRTIAEAALPSAEFGPMLADVETLRMQPMAVAVFGAGLLLLAAAGILAAVALVRAGAGGRTWPRWAGLPLALGLLLLLPQFYGGPEIRIAHGVLVAAGCVLLAAAVRPLTIAADDARQ